jgi:hypothetical protein
MLAKIRLNFSSEDKIDKRKKTIFYLSLHYFVPLPLRIKTNSIIMVVIAPTVRLEYEMLFAGLVDLYFPRRLSRPY